MPTPRKAHIVVARGAFVCNVNGKDVFVREGAEYRANDPIVKGRESLFEAKGNA